MISLSLSLCNSFLDEGLYGWGKNDEGALGIDETESREGDRVRKIEIDGDRPKRIDVHGKVLKVQCMSTIHSMIFDISLFFNYLKVY